MSSKRLEDFDVKNVIPKPKKVGVSISIDRNLWLELKNISILNRINISQIVNEILRVGIPKVEV